MPVDILIFLGIGFLMLVKGAEALVESASRIARGVGVSELVIGLTLVSVGTSIPELANAVVSSFYNIQGIAIGNIVGSNINNTTLLLGIALLIRGMTIKRDVIKRDLYIMLFVTFLLFVLLLNRAIGFYEGIFFLILFFAYVNFLFRSQKSEKGGVSDFAKYFIKFKYLAVFSVLKNRIAKKKQEIPETNIPKKNYKEFEKDILIAFIAIVVIRLGADIVVRNAVSLAQLLNVPVVIISLTLVAFGTTLPELSVSVVSALKKRGDILIGNLIGSNIANILLVLGLAAVINPIVIRGFILYSILFLLVISAILIAFLRRNSLNKWHGIALIVLYLIHLGWVIGSNV